MIYYRKTLFGIGPKLTAVQELAQIYQLGIEAIAISKKQSWGDATLLAGLTPRGIGELGEPGTPGEPGEPEGTDSDITFQSQNNRRVSSASYGYEKRFLSDPEFRLEHGITEENLAAAEVLLESAELMA